MTQQKTSIVHHRKGETTFVVIIGFKHTFKTQSQSDHATDIVVQPAALDTNESPELEQRPILLMELLELTSK